MTSLVGRGGRGICRVRPLMEWGDLLQQHQRVRSRKAAGLFFVLSHLMGVSNSIDLRGIVVLR